MLKIGLFTMILLFPLLAQAQSNLRKENVRVYLSADSSLLVSVYSSLGLSKIPANYQRIVTNDLIAYELLSKASTKISFSKTILKSDDPNYLNEMKQKINLIEDRSTTNQTSYGSSGVSNRSWSNFNYRFSVGDSKPFDAGYAGGNLAVYLQSDPEASEILNKFSFKRKTLLYGTAGFLGSFLVAAINGFTEDETQTTFNPQTNEFEETKKVKTSSAVIVGVGFIGACIGWYNYNDSPEYIFKAVEIYNRNLEKIK